MDGIDSADPMAPAVMQAAKIFIKSDVFATVADSISRLSLELEEKFTNSDPSTWAQMLEDESDGLTAGQKLRSGVKATMLGAFGKSMSKKKLPPVPSNAVTKPDLAALSMKPLPLRTSTAHPSEDASRRLDDKGGIDARLGGFQGVDLSSEKATRVRLQPLGYPPEGTRPCVCHNLSNQQGMAARLDGFRGAELGDSEKVTQYIRSLKSSGVQTDESYSREATGMALMAQMEEALLNRGKELSALKVASSAAAEAAKLREARLLAELAEREGQVLERDQQINELHVGVSNLVGRLQRKSKERRPLSQTQQTDHLGRAPPSGTR